MNISTLLHKYDQPVPRYTSYPTAVHFKEQISHAHHSKLLAELPAEQPVSLYVHIPFCHVLCHYCGCHTKVVNSYSPVKSYVQTLLKEMHILGEKLNARLPISQLHFGGGSPNFLEEEDMASIISALKQYFDFGKEAEIAIEADPRLLSPCKIGALADLGFTRVSLGVQDFNPEVQKAVNRIQPFEKVQESVLNLREAGIDRINFDLMTGLPLQTLKSVERSAERAVSLYPDRFAVFAYAHVPWMKKQQKLLEKYVMPNTELRFEMMLLVKEVLESAGYHALGIDHFAHETDSLYKAYKNKKLRRNFQGYTDDPARNVIGFGLSSISGFEGAYVQNITEAPAYKKAIESGELPIMRGCILSDDDRARRKLIESIMCGIKTDISAYPEALDNLKELEKDRLIDIDNGYVTLTTEGWPFARIVASCFDVYFHPQEGRHSKAI